MCAIGRLRDYGVVYRPLRNTVDLVALPDDDDSLNYSWSSYDEVESEINYEERGEGAGR